MSFIAELQRRNVIRVAILYVVGSWLVLQVGDLLFDLMGLPDYALRIVLGILVLGLPLVLVGAWVYEVTPEGIRKESEIDRSESITTQTGHKLNIAVIVAIALGIGTVLADRFLLDRPGTAGASDDVASAGATPAEAATAPAEEATSEGDINAIAVLPFEDFSQARDQAYLATGIADTILHALAQVDGLKVAARTSSFRLAEQKADIATVGERLKVGAVLEGSVQKAGEQLRIIAQLVRVSDESQLWSETFDRPAGDIFAIQDEIAAAVVSALGQDPRGASVATADNRRTSPELYDLFLKGRNLWVQRTMESTGEAVRLLREVVARDPDFAPGHSELAHAIAINASYSGNADAVSDIVEQLAERALELDPEDPIAFRVLGGIASGNGDAQREIELLRRSIELNPNDPTTHAYLADALSSGARWDEAEVHYRAAVELDPLNVYGRDRLASFLAGLRGDMDGALTVLEETIKLAPDDIRTWQGARNVYWSLERYADATRAAFRRLTIDPRSPAGLMSLAEDLATLGEIETAERWVALAQTMEPTITTPCSWYLARNLERALACQEAALGEDPSISEIFGYAQALWASGRDAEALEAFETVLDRSQDDREQGFVRYPDLVALIARVMIRPGLDLPVTAEDRAAPAALREQIVGQSPLVDRGSLLHVLLGEGRTSEAVAVFEEVRLDFNMASRIEVIPLFAALRTEPSVQQRLTAFTDKIAAEYAALAADSDPLILDPPATVDQLVAELAPR